MAQPQTGPFDVDPTRPLPHLGGGADAFAVRGHDGLLAIRVLAHAPPRAEPLVRLNGARVAGVSLPVAHHAARFPDGVAPALVCTRPEGAPLGHGLRPSRIWGEAELLACVLRPVVAALAGLQAAGVTHRAIRLDNVFQTQPGTAVTLGEAWSRPPAMLQPAWMEPAPAATCHPAGRGNGSTADDVYALGALLLLLARGGDVRLADATMDEVVAAKLQHGSFAAMSGGARLPPAIGELARGMLFDDPEHRPQPALLADPDAARARRIPTRVTRRAQRPLTLGAAQVWDARGLAQHVANDGAATGALLTGGRVERWLRLSLGETQLAAAVDGIRAAMADTPLGVAVASCHLVAVLDPAAPLCWPGLRCWPDGIAPLLLQGPEVGLALAQMAEADVVPGWAERRSEAMGASLARMEWRPMQSALRSGPAALPRLRYERNPTLACQGALAAHAPLGPDDMLLALNALAALPGRPPLPLDAEAVAFVAARCATPSGAKSAQTATGQLAMLARIEARVRGQPTPALAAWLVGALADKVAARPGPAARKSLTRALEAAAARGALGAILALLRGSAARLAEQREAASAAARIAAIDRALLAAGARGAGRVAAGEVGREFAVACSALFAGATLIAFALG